MHKYTPRWHGPSRLSFLAIPGVYLPVAHGALPGPYPEATQGVDQQPQLRGAGSWPMEKVERTQGESHLCSAYHQQDW